MNNPTLSPDLPELDACPFCAAGQTQIVENGKMWTGMKYSEPASVSVRHWCEQEPGQPSRAIERVGRDRASAIAAWNRRASRAGAAVPPDLPPSHQRLCADIATLARQGALSQIDADTIRAASTQRLAGQGQAQAAPEKGNY